MSVKEQIYNRMTTHGVDYTDTELATALNLNPNTVRRARRELVTEGRVEEAGRWAGRTTWTVRQQELGAVS